MRYYHTLEKVKSCNKNWCSFLLISPRNHFFGVGFWDIAGRRSPMWARADAGRFPSNLASCLERNFTFLNDRNAFSFSFCFWIKLRYFSSWFWFWFLSTSVCRSCSVAKAKTNVTEYLVSCKPVLLKMYVPLKWSCFKITVALTLSLFIFFNCSVVVVYRS